MKPPVVLITCSIMLALPLQAADIYRWVDEQGHTQFSDVVPEKYKKSAKKMDSKQFEPSAEQRSEAEARAAQDKARAAESAQQTAAPDPPRAVTPGAAASARNKPQVDKNTDCATWLRLYRESLDCFAPYIVANGTTKAEAFTKCTVVPDPAPKCGPPK